MGKQHLHEYKIKIKYEMCILYYEILCMAYIIFVGGWHANAYDTRISSTLRKLILNKMSRKHPGIGAMKEIARNTAHWSRIDDNIIDDIILNI